MATSVTSFNPSARLNMPNGLIAVPPKSARTCQVQQKNMWMPTSLQFSNARRQHILKVSGGNPNPIPATGSVSPSEMVKQLYLCINTRDMKGLREIISEECCIDDFSFSKPFEGKKEVVNFFEQLATSMGRNVRFKIRNVEEDEVTAWMSWHLEWKETQIPMTRGCSFYEFTKAEKGLVLRKAQVIIESPIKPGGIALILLKAVTSLFDEFPQAAEWFLKSPHVIVRWAQHAYSLLLAPFVNPLLASYMNFWRFTAQILSYAISILIYILKVFFN